MSHFKASKVNLDGSLSTLDHLGASELDTWLQENYGKHATVCIERDDGNRVTFTDNGLHWKIIQRTKKG